MAADELHRRCAGLSGEPGPSTSAPRSQRASDLAHDFLGALVVKILRQRLRSKVVLLGVVLTALIALYFIVRAVWPFGDDRAHMIPLLTNIFWGLACSVAWAITPAVGYAVVDVELRRETPGFLTLAGVSPERFVLSTAFSTLCLCGLVCSALLPFLTLTVLLGGATWLELGWRTGLIGLVAILYAVAGVCLGTFARTAASRAAAGLLLLGVATLGLLGAKAALSGAGVASHARTVALAALFVLPVLWFFTRRNARRYTARHRGVVSVADWAAPRAD